MIYTSAVTLVVEGYCTNENYKTVLGLDPRYNYSGLGSSGHILILLSTNEYLEKTQQSF